MLGLPIEAISMLASTLMGGLMKLWGNQRADLAEERKFQHKTMEQIEAMTQNARAYNNPGAAWIRRFIVVMCFVLGGFIVVGAPLLEQVTNVPIEMTTGFKFLFFDFTDTVTEYVQLEGWVTPEWLPVAIMNVIGFYFGSAAMRR